MAYEFKITRRVEFSETDMAGIVHYSNFFRYMEAAESAFFRSLGLSLRAPRAAHEVGWPRVHAECDDSRPLCFEDEIEIHVLVAEKGARKLEGRPIRQPELEAAVRRAAQANPEAQAMVAADRRAPYEYVNIAVDTVRLGGIRQLGLQVREGGARTR